MSTSHSTTTHPSSRRHSSQPYDVPVAAPGGVDSDEGVVSEATRQDEKVMVLAKTVDDMKSKRCWICYEDDESLASSPSSSSIQNDTIKRNWVHACQCTLVAHEDCLLNWVSTYQTTHPPPPGIPTSSAPVKCPQCATPYTIIQSSSSFLNTLHRLRIRYDSLLVGVAVGGVTVASLSTLSLYGLIATRHFLGHVKWKQFVMSNQMGFGRLLQLSLVAPTLILSRTTLIDGLLPFLPLSMVLSSLPSPGQPGYLEGLEGMDWTYPPGPALTLCLLPWWRLGWSWIWRKVSQIIIARERKLLRMSNTSNLTSTIVEDGAGRNDRRGHEQDDILVDFQFNFGNGVQNGNQPNPAAEGADRALNLSLPSLRKVIRSSLGALLFPTIAAGSGALLLLLGRRSVILQRWLGIRIMSRSTSTSGVGTVTVDATAKLVWTSMLGIASWAFHPLLSSSHGSLATPRRRSDDGSSVIVMGMGRNFEDPVWWRTAVGGALVVMVKDAVSLVEKVMGMRRVGRRRVGGYPFAQGLDVEGVGTE